MKCKDVERVGGTLNPDVRSDSLPYESSISSSLRIFTQSDRQRMKQTEDGTWLKKQWQEISYTATFRISSSSSSSSTLPFPSRGHKIGRRP